MHIISVICLRMFCYSCWLCDEAFPACKHTAAAIETPQTFTMLYIQEQIASMWRFATTSVGLGPVHQERRRSTYHLSESPAAFPSSAKRGTKADLLHMCLPWALSSQTSLFLPHNRLFFVREAAVYSSWWDRTVAAGRIPQASRISISTWYEKHHRQQTAGRPSCVVAGRVARLI